MFDLLRKQKAQCLSQNTFDGSDGKFSCGRNLTCSRHHVNLAGISQNHESLDCGGNRRKDISSRSDDQERATCITKDTALLANMRLAGELLL